MRYLQDLEFRTQYALPLTERDEEVNVDLFAGGGGASTGLEMGLGRAIHLAINHNPAAISMHQANHPGAVHLTTNVWDVDPTQALAGRRVGWLHASPDCTHHSQAAGGQPRKQEIRDLSWVVIRWAALTRPRVISLENVKQIRQWGPLVAKRCPKTGRVLRVDRTVAAAGERVPRHEQYLIPDPKRKGLYWRRFLQCLRGLGYDVDYWVLRNCNYGDPTSRERLYLVARRDGIKPVKPEQTHFEKPKRGQKAWRTAADCIDWSLPCPSIFLSAEEGKAAGVRRPLADATMRRIAQGIQREVINRQKPFIVPIANWSTETIQSVDKPLSTVTAWPRGGSHALATAFLAQANAGFNVVHSRPVDAPISAIQTTGSQQQLVAAFLAHLRGNCDARACDDPLRTVSAGGQHHGLVELHLSKEHEAGALRCAAFLMRYYSEGGQWGDLRDPLATITTKERLALVTVWIAGAPYVIVDIGLRMLQPHELYLAQGFPPNYIIDRGHDGSRFTKAEQVHMCGNSVSPGTMAAIARANDPWRRKPERMAA